jgi:hypothetical protein
MQEAILKQLLIIHKIARCLLKNDIIGERAEKTLRAVYKKMVDDAYQNYIETEKEAWAEYQQIENAAYPSYEKGIIGFSQYKRIERSAYRKYRKIRTCAIIEYGKIQRTLFSEFDRYVTLFYREEKMKKRKEWLSLMRTSLSQGQLQR